MENRNSVRQGKAQIDLSLPVQARIAQFVQTGGDPYRLMVGETTVRLLFDEQSPSLQSRLTALGKR